MKLLREYVEPGLIEHYIVEAESGDRNVMLRGLFTEADTANRNRRIYPEYIMDREIFKLQEKIAKGDFPLGSADHPSNPEMKLEDAAVVIQSLKKDGKKYFGEAKILKNTPKGNILFNLCKEGIKLGISSRGLGSTSEKDGISMVCEDYNLLTFDVVADPSCKDAIMSSVFESMEYFVENGQIKEDLAMSYKNQAKNLKKEELNTGIVKLFDAFLQEI